MVLLILIELAHGNTNQTGVQINRAISERIREAMGDQFAEFSVQSYLLYGALNSLLAEGLISKENFDYYIEPNGITYLNRQLGTLGTFANFLKAFSDAGSASYSIKRLPKQTT